VWGEQIVERILGEITQIDHLFTMYADLFTLVQQEKPGLIEKTALASVLHSFYNGIEAICLTIAKEIDLHVPVGSRWHRDLLVQMGQANDNRPLVFSGAILAHLAEYLSFRHFYRHAYSFMIEWEKLERLVLEMSEVWYQTRAELLLFLDEK
jgi:hypothetical protein